MADHADIDHTGLTGVGDLSGHTGDTTDAHDASAISFTPAGTVAATDVQAAIEEVASEAASGGGIAATLLDAKGDLIAASAADTAARLAVGTNGQLLAADSSQSSGLAWLGSAWASYSPSLTGSGSNPTLGSGSAVGGRWSQVGKIIVGNGYVIFGTSGVAVGSGDYRISLPANAATTGWLVVGSAYYYDSSAARWYVGTAFLQSATTLEILLNNATAKVGAASPVVPAASDQIAVSFAYEAA